MESLTPQRRRISTVLFPLSISATGAHLCRLDTIIWVRSGTVMWEPCIPGGLPFSGYLVAQLLRGGWDSLILPAASILVVLSGPGNYLIKGLRVWPLFRRKIHEKIRTTPVALMKAGLASF
jgi:hypothetical protein